MRIDLEYMYRWPDRDAVAFYAADIIDDAGKRYPVRVMLEGIAAALFEDEVQGSYRDIVEALYRKELEQLVKSGKLVPQNPKGTVNVVFLVNGNGREQVKPGDIVVDDAVDKLKGVARELSRL